MQKTNYICESYQLFKLFSVNSYMISTIQDILALAS